MEREQILIGKTNREQLELKAHWALCDLSDFFKGENNRLYYKVNALLRDLDHIRDERNPGE